MRPDHSARDAVQRLHPYIPGKSLEKVKAEFGLSSVIKMASNENPLGCPIQLDQLRSVLETAFYYPDSDSSPLLQKLARKWDVRSKNIILGNGSDEVMQCVGGVFLNPGDEVLITECTFSLYTFVATLFGAVCKKIPLEQFQYNLDAFFPHISDKTRLIFLANPNNPTGTYITEESLTSFLKRCPRRIIVILDEAYAEYAETKDFPQTVSMIEHHPNLMVLRTFSKLYGLAGFRIGYGIGSEGIIDLLNKVRLPFNVNVFALKAAELALDASDFIQKSLECVQNGKSFFYKQFTRLGLSYLLSQANFICVFLPCGGIFMFQELQKKGFIVRSLESFGLPHAIRVTIGLEEHNHGLIQAMEEILKNLNI